MIELDFELEIDAGEIFEKTYSNNLNWPVQIPLLHSCTVANQLFTVGGR